jgi:hypothetical protein
MKHRMNEQKLMKLSRKNIHNRWNEISPNNWNRLDKLSQLPWEKKWGFEKIIGFLSSNFLKLCRKIHVMCGSFWGLKTIKMVAVAMATKVHFFLIHSKLHKCLQ